MKIGLLTLQLHLEACESLKQKRRIIKPILSRLHKEFNISTAEVGLNDHWQSSVLACVVVGKDCAYTHKAMQIVLAYFVNQWPEHQIVDHRIECI